MFGSHLFNSTVPGLSTPAPKNKFIGLLLERPFYPGISSYLGLGAHPPLPYNLDNSKTLFTSVLPSNPGPLYWRAPITRVTIDTGGTKQYMRLGGSEATGVSSIYPVALLDSGGIQMIATRSFANAFYGTWGIGPGQEDGQCTSFSPSLQTRLLKLSISL